MNNRKAIQKYITLLMGFFALLGALFLIFAYIYQGSKVTPESGGQLIVAQLAPPPSLSPLAYGTDDRTNIINHLMFRSLMKPDPINQELKQDLGSCEFGRVVWEVSCTILPGSLFSDGSAITREDVIASFVLYREQARSQDILGILSRTSISEGPSWEIVFRTNSSRIKEISELLVLPILPQSKLELVKSASISEKVPVSGMLKYTGRETNETTGVTKYFFEKTATSSFLASKLVFTFYGDNVAAFQDNVGQASYILPSTWTGVGSMGDFQEITLEIPEVLAVFPNIKTLPLALRKPLWESIMLLKKSFPDRMFSSNLPPVIASTLLQDETISHSGVIAHIQEWLRTVGKYPKNDILMTLEQSKNNLQTQSWSTLSNPGYSTVITIPTNQKLFVATWSFAFRGQAPIGSDSVTVNGFRLTEFHGRDFAYRASKDIGTLKNGSNSYEIVFWKKNAIISRENIAVEMIIDANKAQIRSDEISELYHPEIALARREAAIKKIQDLIDTIKTYPETTYLNELWEKATITLASLAQEPMSDVLWQKLEEILVQSWFEVVQKKLSIDELRDMVKNDKRTYDLLLTGIYLGKEGKDIFSFLHSHGMESGYNFWWVHDTKLDYALSEFRNATSDNSNFPVFMKRIADKIAKDWYLYPLDMRTQIAYIRKDIMNRSWITLRRFSSLEDVGLLFPESGLNANYTIDMNTKSLQGFFQFIDSTFRK